MHGEYLKSSLKDDKIYEKGVFNYGLKDGEWKSWYDNGFLKEIITWKKGRKTGAYKFFDKEGNLVEEGKFLEGDKNGICVSISGKEIKRQSFKKGILDGVSKEYFNERLVRKGGYKKGLKHGSWEENGEKKFYKNGKFINKNKQTSKSGVFKEKS